MSQEERLSELAETIVERARKAGAEIAEVVAHGGSELSAKVRLREPELIHEAQSSGVGLRVMKAGRSGMTRTSDTTEAGIAVLVRDAIELMELSQPDPYSAPPEAKDLARGPFPSLELFDPSTASIDAETARGMALAGEDAALSADPRISNSDGAEMSRSSTVRVLVTSGGFKGAYRGTYQSLNVSPVAEEAGGKKQTGHYWDGRRFVKDLESAQSIGRKAAERTLAKLGARKVESAEVPVIFDPDAGRSLLSLLFDCIDGHALYRRTSYLCDREGDTVASPLITIADDPLIPRGPGSRPFDGEGLSSRKNMVIERGVLKNYLLDTYAARKLNKQSTGSASRSPGGAPSVSASNFILAAGDRKPEEILSEVERGLYVTGMMGFGFNAVTGDFSRGAVGFWIEKGKKSFPVSEVTISLGFNELWKRIDAVGSDLELKTRFATPTFRVSKMTVAGV